MRGTHVEELVGGLGSMRVAADGEARDGASGYPARVIRTKYRGAMGLVPWTQSVASGANPLRGVEALR